MTPAISHWQFGPLPGPVALAGCGDLIHALRATLHRWSVAPWPQSGARPPALIAVARRENGYVLTSQSIDGEEAYDDVPSIVCAFMAELITAFGATRPDSLFLHAGAAVVEGRLIAFPARGKTGKSFLTAQLARRGGLIFSDDVLPVNLRNLQGMALGIEPRLRLPLPDAVAPGSRGWVEEHRRLANRKMTYLALPRGGPAGLAPFGLERPIGAIVLLEREADAPASLAPCPRSDIMRLLIRQHFGAGAPVVTVVERFKALVESVPCYRLRFAGGEEAPDLLHRMALKAA